MDDMTVNLEIATNVAADEEELTLLTNQLRRQLLELDLNAVKLKRSDERPERSKVSDVVVVGALVVSLARSPRLLAALLSTIQAWLTSRAGRSAKVILDGDMLELTGLSSNDQRLVIENFVLRHTKDNGSHQQ